MKYTSLLLAIMVIIATQIATAQIASSAHDFSGQGWGTTQICQPCHTPHKATLLSDAPLWNHQLTGATFQLYTSSTLNTTTLTQPDASSKLCLSCHDGTVALENFGGATGGTHYVTGDALIGTNLSNDHPVSFIYNTALATADGELFDPATHLTSLGGTIAADLLIGGKLQCASCHDAHRGYPNPSLLKISNTGSAFCLTCHDK